MAAERRKQFGLGLAWAAATIVAHVPFTGTQLDPNEINPFRGAEPEDEGLLRARAFIASRAWRSVTKARKGD